MKPFRPGFVGFLASALTLVFFSCTTFEAPPPGSPETGLLVARLRVVNLVPAEIHSSLRDVTVRLVNLEGGARTVPLSPRGLLVLSGNDGEQFFINEVAFTSTRTIRTRNQPRVDVPNSQRLLVEYRYRVLDGRLPVMEGHTVVNTGVIETSVLASTFSGRVSEMDTSRVTLLAPEPPPAVSLAKLGLHDHVRRAFTREVRDSPWLAVPWITW